MFLIKVLANTLYGSGLVRTIHNLLLGHHIYDVLSTTLLYQFLQVLARVESIYGTCRISKTIYDMRFETIGIVNHRLHAKSCFQALGIELSLSLAHHGVYCSSLGLNHCQWHTISIKQYVVCIANT